MKPYDQLTRLGRIRRLRQVALRALEAYDLAAESLRFLTIHTNTMFEVRTADGGRYVLRIYSDEETTLKENQAEIYWLNALVRDTHLRVSEPVSRRDGGHITVVTVPGVPPDQRCVLFRWIPGRPLEHHLTLANYHKYGQALATLHNHAYSLNPLPPHIRPKRWDKVFYYPDEPVVYDTPAYARLFPRERIELLECVIERADAVFARLFADRDGEILIHGDLHFWNVHLHRGQLYLLDFEDINRGYPIQDIAVTLYYGRQHPRYPERRAAFRGGYESVRPWPAEDECTIQTLMAARMVMFMNYVARVDPSPGAFIEERCADLVRFLEICT
jgi:Ser/Thr protein kinase RdoA (MazF antagonist)